MSFEQRSRTFLDELHRSGSRRLLGGCGSVHSGEQQPLNFAGNDYRAMSGNPAVLAASRSSRMVGACASRLLAGNCQEHEQVENAAADLMGFETGLLYGAGYLANIGLLAGVVERSDVIIADKQIHASLVDGAMLSRARLRRFHHNDTTHAAQLLERERRANPERTIWLVTESVFSMDGDLAPLEALATLAERYVAHLIVDEAHALGVFGRYGCGRVSELGLGRRTFAATVTLSKSAGAYGGLVLTSPLVREVLINRSRSLIFNTALPPGVAAAGAAALDLFRQDDSERVALLRRAKWFRQALRARGFSLVQSESHIVPVIIGSSPATVELANRLALRGILCAAIRPPTVARGTERLRFSLTVAHSEADLEQVVLVLHEEARALGIIDASSKP
ncbi:MAG: 8-amino-7-oxononanoate synthase [Bdellovibrionales bacterium]|nr:8-amino-7-oxononanoate synthase [Bdellovibrionales bacterium]